MRRTLAIVFSAFIPLIAYADDTATEAAQDPVTGMIRPAGDSDLSEFLWTFRPVVIFADTPADPRFGEQLERLNAEIEMLIERDVVILTDTDPDAASPLRTKLRPRGYMLVLVGKDGTVSLRKPFPLTARELTRTIDKMPDRQREVRERRGDG